MRDLTPFCVGIAGLHSAVLQETGTDPWDHLQSQRRCLQVGNPRKGASAGINTAFGLVKLRDLMAEQRVGLRPGRIDLRQLNRPGNP
jgi:hypothetical protein